MKHLKLTLFQFLTIHYFVPYDDFNVSLVENLSYVEMQKKQRTYHLPSTRQNFRSNAWLEMIFILVGTSYTRLELPIVTGSFISPPIKGSRELGLFLSEFPTLCRNFRWTSEVLHYFRQRAFGKPSLDRPVWLVWPRVVYLSILKWEMMLWIIIWRTLSLKAQVWKHKSDSKYCKHNFNTCILLVCLAKFVNEPPHILYWIKCLASKIFKIRGTN